MLMCDWLSFSHRWQHPDDDFSYAKNSLSSMQMFSDSPSNGRAPLLCGGPYAPWVRVFFGIAWHKCCTHGRWSSNERILCVLLESSASYILCRSLYKHVFVCRDGVGDDFAGFRCSCTWGNWESTNLLTPVKRKLIFAKKKRAKPTTNDRYRIEPLALADCCVEPDDSADLYLMWMVWHKCRIQNFSSSNALACVWSGRISRRTCGKK